MNKVRFLHIISFNVPYPPDYGGVIEIFCKIKALQKAGIRIILHCYQYGRPIESELDKLCERVHYYPRKKGIEYFFQKIPYIVATRNSIELIRNLQQDDYPILCEGLHCTYPLHQGLLQNRVCIVRSHNIEHEYYGQLAKQEQKISRKLYFYVESIKLSGYESVLKKAKGIAAISFRDHDYFARRYGNSFHVPAFHPFDDLQIQTGDGNYVLYHGNLSVSENAKAAEYLIREVFPSLSMKCLITGKEPGNKLRKLASHLKNVRLIPNPSSEEMRRIITSAKINVLPSFQNTGIKLKILTALFMGQHCIVNSKMIGGSGLESLCSICDTPSEMIQKINELFSSPFDKNEIEKRRLLLHSLYGNQENAQKLIRIIWQD